MNELETFIAKEEAKIALLVAEVERRRKRLALLKEMLDTDVLDTLLEGRAPAVSAESLADATSAPIELVATPDKSKRDWPQFPPLEQVRRKRGEVKLVILGLLNTESYVSIDYVRERLDSDGYSLDPRRVRGELWAYKTKGLVESDSPGSFRLTDLGAAYLESKKPSGMKDLIDEAQK